MTHTCLPSKQVLKGMNSIDTDRVIILTCSGWVGDQEGQPATLAAHIALSLRLGVRLLQVGVSTE